MPVYPGRRAGTWRVTVYARKQQIEEIVEGKKADAKAREAQLRIDLRARSVSSARRVPTFEEFVDKSYAPHAALHLGSKTWKNREYMLAQMTAHIDKVRCDELTTELIDGYVRHLAASHMASSINEHLRILRSMLRWGNRELGIPFPVLRIKMLKEPKRRASAWTSEDVRKLYKAAPETDPRLLDLLHFMLETGVRKGEVLAADWAWVDFDARLLRIPASHVWKPKSGKAREVPLSDSLLSMLAARERTANWVFPTQFGERYLFFPDQLWYRMVRAAGLEGGPHKTRHTFASHFLRARPDLPLLAKVLGHSTTRVTELYAHMLPDHLESARNAVNLAPPKPRRSTRKKKR